MALRINNNVASINAHNQLLRTDDKMNSSLEKLSSGFAINRASDKPAGLVISEQLRAQIGGMDQAIENSQRASNIIGTAEGALSEVNTLLKNIRVLAVEAANTGGMDDQQIRANQDEVDSAIATIDRIANSTRFSGKRLLDGSQDFRITTNIGGTTGPATNLSGTTIRGLQFGSASTISINVAVSRVSERAVNTDEIPDPITKNVTIRFSGKEGSEVISFGKDQTRAQAVDSINALSENTGIRANTDGTLWSTDFGSDARIEVEVLEGTADMFHVSTVGTQDFDDGLDAEATVNGMSGSASGNFLNVSSTFFTGEIELLGSSSSSVGDGGTGTKGRTFVVHESGMTFQLGPNTNPNEQKVVGIASSHSTLLGTKTLFVDSDGNARSGFLSTLKSGGDNDLSTDPDAAVKIIDLAIADVSSQRSQLGAFQKNTLDANISSLRVTNENLTASESRIRDVDFAKEMMEFTKNQILMQSGTSMMSQANTMSQSVLSLLG